MHKLKPGHPAGRNRKRAYLAGALGCLFLVPAAFAEPWKREEITSAYVYNFAKNIEWPMEDRIREFHFLIISDVEAINREMTKLSSSQKLKGKPIRITLSESVVIPKDVHLVFITHGLKALTEPVFRRIEGRKTLLITDGFEDKRSVMINLIGTKDEKIRFEINKANILNQGLKVLPDMVLLGGTEIDVARLYKESQDTLRSKEGKIASLRQRLDSLKAQIETTAREIEKQNLLIEGQMQAIQGQQSQLGRQRDTLSRQSAMLAKSQQALKQQHGLLERQQREVESGKTVLANQQAEINAQNASILRQTRVLAKQDITIASQKSIQRFLILILSLVLGLTYTIYRSFRSKQQSNKKLQEQGRQIEKLNRDLQDRAAALESANKELEAFSYSVSHDLRAPLRNINGFSLAILEDYGDELDERGKDYLRRAMSSAQRMGQLIDDLLKLSRVTRNEMVWQEIDLSGMAKDIADKLCRLQPGRQVDFAIQPGIKIRGDGPLIRIVLENLFDNAWKYTSRHPAARIEFGVRVIGGKPVCFVKDDGAGFDMKYAQKLFGAFQRMHTEGEFPGTGVGLATVQRIIRRHGGEIWAESEVEKGATFYFSLPEKEPGNA